MQAGLNPAIHSANTGSSLRRPTFDAFLKDRQQPAQKPAFSQAVMKKSDRAMSVFKLLVGGVGFGIVMTMLFGSHPRKAIALSVGMAWLQDKLANRITNSDNILPRKMVDWCGKIVGSRGHQHQRDDRCMASVWGVMTALTVTVETVLNYWWGKNKNQQTPTEVIAGLEKKIANKSSLQRLYQWQLSGFKFKERVLEKLNNLKIVRAVSDYLAKPGRVSRFLENNTSARELMQRPVPRFLAKHKKLIGGSLAMIPVLWAGGYIQGLMAATVGRKVQEKASEEQLSGKV